MSIIGEHLRTSNQLFYLVDLLFPGGTKRIASKNIKVPAGKKVIYDERYVDRFNASTSTFTTNERMGSEIELFGKSAKITHAAILCRASVGCSKDLYAEIWSHDISGSQPDEIIAVTNPLKPAYCIEERFHEVEFAEPVYLNGDKKYWFVLYSEYTGTGDYYLVGANYYGNRPLYQRNTSGVWSQYHAVQNLNYALLEVGQPKMYDGIINSIGGVGSTFDIRQFAHSVGSISVNANNNLRFQDLEVRQAVDGAKCLVRVWAEGLEWEDIEKDGLIYSGRFEKSHHSKDEYHFKIESGNRGRMKTMPGAYITDTTFPSHRKEGGGGSVSGLPLPLIYGNFDKGIPLLPTHTTNFEYAICLGICKSDWDDFYDTVKNVYDKDGNVLTSTGFTVLSSITEGGVPYSYLDFITDKTSVEGLSCSVDGYVDTAGDITGGADVLIENPVDIINHIIRNHSIDYSIDPPSFALSKASIFGMKFATYINDTVNGLDLVKRIAHQAQLSVLERANKLALVGVNVVAKPQAYMHSELEGYGEPIFTKTEIGNIVNRLTINYALNVVQGKYESQMVFNELNDPLCGRSFGEYGEVPEVVLNLPDVRTNEAAQQVANRFLAINALRHDIVSIPMKFDKAHELLEGSCVSWTIPEGPSWDGKGFIDQNMILLEKAYGDDSIDTRWWRIAIDVNYGGQVDETVGYVLDSENKFIFDSKGSGIRDSKWRMN